MVITLELLRTELKSHGVAFHHSMKEPRLAQLLIEKYEELGIPVTDELKAVADTGKEKDAPLAPQKNQNKNTENEKEVTMLVNVKHDGVLYSAGEKVSLDEETLEVLTKLGAVK